MATKKQTRVGRVVSDKMDKTVVVSVETRKPHPLYRRIVRSNKRYKAHDEENEARVGDLVQIVESRPISKDKHWRVAAILEKVARPDVTPDVAAELPTEEPAEQQG